MRWAWLVFTCVPVHAQILDLDGDVISDIRSKQGLAAGGRAVDQLWERLLRRGLSDPSFVEGAAQVATYYRRDGYDLKAERVLNKAIAMAGQEDEHAGWQLMQELAQHYKHVKQAMKAAFTYGRLLGELRKHTESVDMLVNTLHEYGCLKDEMGDLDEAEALLTELSGLSPGSSISLAQFYSNHGRVEEAEEVLKRTLTDISLAPGGRRDVIRGYIDLLNNEHRFGEAANLRRDLIKSWNNRLRRIRVSPPIRRARHSP